MHGYRPRMLETMVEAALKRAPVVALLGPRQCGKTTLAHHIVSDRNAVYLDLQSRSDQNNLNEPELFLNRHADQLVCLDEIQRIPDLFPILRSTVDQLRREGCCLVLGSASRDLIRQSSESLAGRIAHLHGQTVNYRMIAESIDASIPTVKSYLSLLEQTFMIRLLPPFGANLRKRLVKSPKLYVRDTGLLHTLLDLDSLDDVQGHPIWGHSWEGYVIENLCTRFQNHRASFVRTGNGAEVDLVLQRGTEVLLFECKASQAPKPSRGLHHLIGDLHPTRTYVVAPVDEAYPYNESTTVSPLRALVT